MLLPRIAAPARAVSSQVSSSIASAPRRLDAVRPTTVTSPTLSFIRYATHQAQGRANGAKDGPGKRLGAKKSGGEYVIPGNIIFRQRGTSWFPGENCKFGRDHCVFATESGFVRYYRDPFKHPKRQYIGVALNKDDKLPYPRNAARMRKLNMVVTQSEARSQQIASTSDADSQVPAPRPTLTMGKGYIYREANWSLGRAAERKEVPYKKFVPGDRWAAWRKSQARKARNLENKKLRNAGKKVSKPKRR